MTTTTTRSIEKVLRLGTVEGMSVFCKVEYKDGKLSISGVEGPKRNGDAKGSCGQIIMGFKEYDKRGYKSLKDITPAEGWTHDTIKQFFDIWVAWHLNDMKAGCRHQRANWDTSAEVEVVTYKLTTEAHATMRRAEKKAKEAAANGVVADLDDTEKLLIGPDWFKDRHTPPDADGPLSGCYEVSKRETKAVNWIHPEEHPAGILGKPCEVCGYRYGTAWLKDDVPDDVLDAIESFPDTDKTPAWV